MRIIVRDARGHKRGEYQKDYMTQGGTPKKRVPPFSAFIPKEAINKNGRAKK